jgi:hypothetical protein
VSFLFAWLAPQGADANGQLSARAAAITGQQAADEISANVQAVLSDGSLASLTFDYSTLAQNRGALRTAYATATRLSAIMIGDFLNTLTNAQLQSAFGISSAQATSLQTNKLAPAASLAASIRAATGA